MSVNPPQILMARNSRSANTASAALSSPTETHAAAAGIFRTAGSPPPPWHIEEGAAYVGSSDEEGEEGKIEIDMTFTKSCPMPGNVKIVVEGTTFWAHKEVLYFASPFFEAALSGHWAETTRPRSISSVITISQPPSVPGIKSPRIIEEDDANLEMIFSPSPLDSDGEFDEVEVPSSSETGEKGETSASEGEASEQDGRKFKAEEKEKARQESLNKLQSVGASRGSTHIRDKTMKRQTQGKIKHGKTPDAVIVIKEEKASTFHDFLKYTYPHLTCTITWNNVEGLMNISHKLTVPTLTQECLTFLLTHAAGKPIKAMRIAELFGEEELYRESSRFVLDNPGGWTEQELSTLSPETLLKLEKRRTWFLERVLKLGLTQVAKEYQCCQTCPDPPTCGRLLEEKWRQAYHAVFRFGPCQPSMVFRYLRQLEGVTPPLALTHLNCQATAKAFTATLFDRMFSLGVRPSPTEPQSIGARVAAVANATSGPRRHFLYCMLKNDVPAKPRRSREQ